MLEGGTLKDPRHLTWPGHEAEASAAWTAGLARGSRAVVAMLCAGLLNGELGWYAGGSPFPRERECRRARDA